MAILVMNHGLEAPQQHPEQSSGLHNATQCLEYQTQPGTFSISWRVLEQ
ncbi:MAG: hypothetical protein JXA82_08845 [Sedimentisphaerales bacterium]|nr:hypothetical protein [Sedimentisphaerales bacterium]